MGKIDAVNFSRADAYFFQECLQCLRHRGVGYEIAVVGCVIYAANEVNMVARPTGKSLFSGNHHRRNPDQFRVDMGEDHEELIGTAECPPPAQMPRKRLKYAEGRRATQQTVPCSCQTGETFPALQSGRANPDGVGFQRWLFLARPVQIAGEGIAYSPGLSLPHPAS